MAEWTLNGRQEVGGFEELLSSPEMIAGELSKFRHHLGKEFTLDMLLKVYEIRAKAKLAKAIYDLPEFTVDQIFKAFNDGQEIKIQSTVYAEIEKEN